MLVETSFPQTVFVNKKKDMGLRLTRLVRMRRAPKIPLGCDRAETNVLQNLPSLGVQPTKDLMATCTMRFDRRDSVIIR
jgi:hypothetical protein